jgi:hypothetical protein
LPSDVLEVARIFVVTPMASDPAANPVNNSATLRRCG